MKILGYENITVLRSFEYEAGKKILLYIEEETETAYPYGIVFEKPYKGTYYYDVERSGAYVYATQKEAIDEFTRRINHALTIILAEQK